MNALPLPRASPPSLPPAGLPPDAASWLTLCIYYEARGEPPDGKAAVALVVLNRTRRRPPYLSDGTVGGTILHPDQFSWTAWDMIKGAYVKVAHTAAEELVRVAELYAKARADRVTWGQCAAPALAVLAGAYRGGPAYARLGPDALLYDNLGVSQPAWATPDKLICQIGRHSFYRA